MIEIKKELKTFLSKWFCDTCYGEHKEKCEIASKPIVLLSYPPQHTYWCPICSKQFTPEDSLHKISYEEKNE